MSGAGRREPSTGELIPLHFVGCLKLLRKKGGDPQHRAQDGERALELALEQGVPWDWPHARGWPPAEDLAGVRRSLSFLTEDGTEGSVCSGLPEAELLSSTRRSQLGELGGGRGLGDPLLWQGCTPEPPPLHIPCLAPWPQADTGGSAVPLQPLASSTLLSAGGEGDIPGAAAQHHRGVPQGPPSGWGGLGIAVPNWGAPVLGSGGSGRDCSSLGDSSGASECFVTAVEILEPSEAGGCLGAQHPCLPEPRAAGEAPSPTKAATWELPPTSPPNMEPVQGEDFLGGSRAAPRCEDGSDVGEAGELLARFQRCSLQGSPPRTPGPLCSPASLAAGDVAPWGQESPRHRHVTPRTKSRLQASAARLNASSSSSLFDETLEMPRRPPRLRAPRGVPRDPATTSGHCVTLKGEDVSSGDGEGTGSLDDTEILPRAPSQPSLPLGASTSHGSSPTVLLVHGDPQAPPSEARGSPGSSPTVLLVPGDPQDSQLDARDSPCAISSPNPGVTEGGSGWQDPTSLGTQQPSWPQGSSSHLPAPRQPGSTAVELGSPAVPFSPAGCSTCCSREHLEDEEQVPTERLSPGDTAVQDGCPVPPRPLSDEGLRRRLRALGDNPGPVTKLTRGLYLRRLEELARRPQGRPAGHSPELVAALRTGCVPDCAQDELALAQQFDRPDRNRHWREGLVKSSFNYLLLDPRTTQNLPLRSHHMSPAECFATFVKAIFYVGKGTRARPYCHLTEALSQHRAGTQKGCPKVRRILEIWASGQGVISVHCFQNTVPAEAYTREGCLVEALGLQTITNQRKGNCYGVAAGWPAERRRRLGVHMLHRAMSIFLAEGERQLRPADIQGGR